MKLTRFLVGSVLGLPTEPEVTTTAFTTTEKPINVTEIVTLQDKGHFFEVEFFKQKNGNSRTENSFNFPCL